MALSLALPAWPSRDVSIFEFLVSRGHKTFLFNSKKKNAKQVLVVCLKREGTTTAFHNSSAALVKAENKEYTV